MDKKNIFISWSGPSSHRAALVLKKWLPSIIQTLDPFVSSEDIEKGVSWFDKIGNQLGQIDFGILCVTRDNINAPWLLFEAGALSKNLDRSRVVPLLFGVSNSDLKGPLAQLNTASFDESDMKRLLLTINSHLRDQGITENQLDTAFQLCWPKLQQQLAEAMQPSGETEQNLPPRSRDDVLDEILQLARTTAQTLPKTTMTRPIASARVINMDLVRKIRDIILQMVQEDKTHIDSKEIFKILIDAGEVIPDYSMNEALSYLRETGSIGGSGYIISKAVMEHGAMIITTVDPDYLAKIGG